MGINAPYLVCPLHTQAAWEASGNEETTEETQTASSEDHESALGEQAEQEDTQES